MKLYTEEQVLKALWEKEHPHSDGKNIDEIMKWLTPIELPSEISDDVLFEQATVAMEEIYGYGSDTEIDAYFRGAKWMQKQYNK